MKGKLKCRCENLNFFMTKV